ncbi:NAD(P)/FAD-dependent oxidoreductase [Sunxiuqinia sp. sy24]|uniref:NAD(P)/FAD-dependent oxidoreductase n=1 Tax=Sunxiuqinia sp. sy24 TaxID=3461495 RepID=UPI0040459D08
MNVNYLIVGQGLAGSLLVHELEKAGKLCLVVDDPLQAKASDVAAGVINPVVFRRLTKSWLIDDLFFRLLKTYAELEELFGIQFYYPLQIKKVLGEDETDFWQKKGLKNELQNYISFKPDEQPHEFIQSDFGMGTVTQSGRVDLKLLIESMQAHLIQKQMIRFEKFDFNALTLTDQQVNYKDIRADKIIFCEGHAASANPFFTQIHFRHTKGEVLRIKPEKYNADFILNKAIFLMPEGQQYYRLGATYSWDDLSLSSTAKAREELQDKLAKIFTDTYQLIDQQTGIRPTTHDRRPVMGLHPEYPAIGILNGLGSKGAMLGPYFARQLSDFLCGKLGQIHPEVSISRYFPKRN